MINWNKKLQAPGVRLVVLVRTPLGLMERDATVGDMRMMLRTQGLDLTTSEALSWGTKFPAEASHLTRICLLQQRLADLRYRLRHHPRLRRASP